MPYQHGVRVLEQATSIVAPILGTAGLQVVFGTAPINLADDPYKVTNTPLIAYSWAEAVKQLGYSADYKNYTLCEAMYASFQLIGVAPVIFINVLDPKKHKKKNEAATVPVEEMEAVVPITGILKDTVTVKMKGADEESEDTPLGFETDYLLSFDDDGNLLVTLIAGGAGAAAKALVVESTSIDPTAVKPSDIIGASATGGAKGFEVLQQIYPKYGMTPGLLLAPGWSHIPDVGIVLAAKCEEINGYFTCECLIDIDSTADGCTAYSDIKVAKEAAGCVSAHAMALWPCIAVGSHWFWYSAIMGALIAKVDAENDDVPNLSPSNKLIGATGTVLATGEEVLLDQVQGNAVNSFGVTTAINVNGWRTWGNNSAIYPASTDPKDRWFCCRRFFSWWGNSFILTYFQKVDNPMNPRLIETIVDSENIRGASYVSQGKCARAEIVYNADENPVTDLLNGKITFHQYLTPYPPAEDILNILEFDPNALSDALGG
jgi:hypothetical protein